MSFLGEYEAADALMVKAIPLNPLLYWWFNLPPIFKALKANQFQANDFAGWSFNLLLTYAAGIFPSMCSVFYHVIFVAITIISLQSVTVTNWSAQQISLLRSAPAYLF